MGNDENVLIGREPWNKIGQADTTYDELLELFDEIDEIYRTRIRKEYFGI